MVEATVALRNGEVQTVYANDFNELDKLINWEEVAQIIGKTIKLKDMKQGKERLNNGNPL
jgi:hypothetical protein